MSTPAVSGSALGPSPGQILFGREHFSPTKPSLVISHAQQKANLARIRDNQRRSRARRREYIQELEQRLRVFELQGVEASAEVQVAARRVAEENRQLRELLSKHGFGDDYIAQYLQAGAIPSVDQASGHRFVPGDSGQSVQSLHHLIAPRRPLGLDPAVPFPLPSQANRDISTSGATSTVSAAWDTHNPTMHSYTHQHSINTSPESVGSLGAHHYSTHVYTDGSTPIIKAESFSGQSSTSMMSDISHLESNSTTQAISNDNRTAMSYNVAMNPYHNSMGRDYGAPGGYY